MENVGDRSKGRIFSKGVTSEGTILLDEALQAHVLERHLLSDDKSDLSELGSEKGAVGVTESVHGSTNINVGEKREVWTWPSLSTLL